MVDYVPKPIKNVAGKAFFRAKVSILGLYDSAKKTLKGRSENNTDLSAQRNEMVPNEHYTKEELPFNSLITDFF